VNLISIGKETKLSFGGGGCEYHQIVYVAYPGTTQLISGEVTLLTNPQKPG